MNIFKKKVTEQEWGFEKDDTINDRWFEEKKTNYTCKSIRRTRQ